MEHEVSLNNSGGLAEIYQSVDIKFAFCEVDKQKSGKMKISQMHPWIKCRDFLGDALFATHHKRSYGIYGFNWDGTKQIVPTKLTYLLIQHSNKVQLESIVKVINQLEKKVRWKRTKLIDLNTKAGSVPVYLATSSGKWVSSSALISLYTMLWRLCVNDFKDDESLDDFLDRCAAGGGNDGTYLKSIVAAQKAMGLKEHLFYTIMRYNKTVFADSYEYQPQDSPGRVHNNNGILTLATLTKSFFDSGNEPSTNYANKTASRLAALIKKKTSKV